MSDSLVTFNDCWLEKDDWLQENLSEDSSEDGMSETSEKNLRYLSILDEGPDLFIPWFLASISSNGGFTELLRRFWNEILMDSFCFTENSIHKPHVLHSIAETLGINNAYTMFAPRSPSINQWATIVGEVLKVKDIIEMLTNNIDSDKLSKSSSSSIPTSSSRGSTVLLLSPEASWWLLPEQTSHSHVYVNRTNWSILDREKHVDSGILNDREKISVIRRGSSISSASIKRSANHDSSTTSTIDISIQTSVRISIENARFDLHLFRLFASHTPRYLSSPEAGIVFHIPS